MSLILIVSITFALPCVQAALGDLDTTFNSPHGFNTLADTFFTDVAIQPETGKSLALGTQAVAANTNRLIIVRYNTNGTLDSSFGTGGIAASPMQAFATKFALHNGKIVALGITQGAQSETLVGRFDANGQVDMTFGQNGFVTHAQVPFSAIAINTDGSIILGGSLPVKGGNIFVAVAKLANNGEIDTTFGSGGINIDEHGAAFDVAVLSDGRILAAGSVDGNGFAVWRYNSNGTLDTSFGGGDGVGTVNLPSAAFALALSVQPDGRIVLAGGADSHDSPPSSVAALARFDSNGNLDASFNGGTVITTLPGVGTSFSDIALQSDGAIVAAGFNRPSADMIDSLVSRFTSNGAPDSSFGTEGNVITDFPGEGGGGRVAIQSDGKIVTAGSTTAGSQVSALIARYLGNGAPPPPPPPSFNFCIDKGSLIFKMNSITGAYEFQDCGKDFVLTGTGAVTVNFCKIDLLDTGPDPNHPDRTVKVRVNTCTKVGTVTLTINSGKAFGYTDNDIATGSCTCH
jgi:uncharacterized delta-60 repeat protein